MATFLEDRMAVSEIAGSYCEGWRGNVAEATIELPDGSKVTVRGTPEEVARVIAAVQSRETRYPVTSVDSAPSSKADRTKVGPRADILGLKANGFFREAPRTIREVKDGLEAQGQIYPVTTLSGALLALVKKRALGRVKQDGLWKYVHR
ncbi:MAG TPA: hypothetical protein VEK37_07740 [Gemmatimonadaceae bacterium]|nr:hypothetical protein [Gemmatimonadaceae bacterium]